MNTPVELPSELIEAFVIAAHSNFAEVQEMLEAEPRLLNAKWLPVDENALEASGHMGRANIADYLLVKGAPLTIFAAAMMGKTDDVAAFLRAEPGLAAALGVHGISILYHAALSGKIEIAELLASHGGGEGADHALHAAVAPGHRDMVAWLLERGADPNTPDFRGQTTLDVALARGHTEIAAMLQRRGAVASRT